MNETNMRVVYINAEGATPSGALMALQAKVQRRLDQGWELGGGPHVMKIEFGYFATQPITAKIESSLYKRVLTHNSKVDKVPDEDWVD